ncbi:hypothetical protein AB0M95_16935 [Sphaerisporangium sp. NPDC051017]|uniref:hypothetical protein n=1 Tax=Sphaerisporangium sp. NPDC051017 TaxID=3154636 RepID=UPI0034378D6F
MLLLRPLTRAIDWTPVGVAILVTAAAAALIRSGSPAGLHATDALVVLRMSALLLGSAAGFFLVDPMTDSTAAEPIPRWLRQWIRTALAIATSAVAWTCVYAITSSRLGPTASLPTAGLVLEAAVCVSTGLACTAFAVRHRTERSAGLAGGAALLALFVVTLFFQDDLSNMSPWPMPNNPHWDSVHLIWLMVSPLPVIALTVANRDLR